MDRMQSHNGKKFKLITSYDECEIIDAEVKYKLTEDNDENLSEEEIRNNVYNSDTLQCAYDDMQEFLIEAMNLVHEWYCEGLKLGWRGLNGYKVFEVGVSYKNGDKKLTESFLRHILPNTDCTFYIYKWRNQFLIKNYHHDAPTGETYLLRPMTEKIRRSLNRE